MFRGDLPQTEIGLAQLCQNVCHNFNFQSGNFKSQKFQDMAEALYLKIFRNGGDFSRQKFPEKLLYFDAESYASFNSCTTCRKNITGYLQEFYTYVLKRK